MDPARNRVERRGRASGQRDAAPAPLGLRLLHAPTGDNTTDVGDARVVVDVPLLEGGQLTRSQAGLGSEHDHRSVEGAELDGEPVDLGAGERVDLTATRDPPLPRAREPDRVLANQLPGDCAVEDLRERAEDLRPIAVREGCLPCRDVRDTPSEVVERAVAKLRKGTRESLAQGPDGARINLGGMGGEEALDKLGESEIGAGTEPKPGCDLVAEMGERRRLRAESAPEAASAVLVPAQPPPVFVRYVDPRCSAGIGISFLVDGVERAARRWSIGPSAPGCEPAIDLGPIEADDVGGEHEARDLPGPPAAKHARGAEAKIVAKLARGEERLVHEASSRARSSSKLIVPSRVISSSERPTRPF